MLCKNGHNNSSDARFCTACGTQEFQAGTQGAVVVHQVNSSSVSTNGLAIAGMVCGILWIYGVGAVLALVFGYISRGQIRETGQKGKGMSTAAIVLGWVGIAGLILMIIVLVTAANSIQSNNYSG